MSELLGERTANQAPDEPKGVWVRTGHTIHTDPDVAPLLIRQQQAAAPQQPQYFVPSRPAEPYRAPATTPEKPRHGLSERARKNIRRTVATLAITTVIGAAGGVVYTLLPEGTKQSIGSTIFHPAPDNGLTMVDQLKNASGTISADQCEDPRSLYGVVTVTAAYPEAPLLTDKDNTTPFRASPYLKPSAEKHLSSSAQDALKNFNTTSGYPELTFNNLPLGITICDLGGGIQQVGKDKFIINRSKLQVQFEDPTAASMLGQTINPKPQTNKATGLKLNPENGEWITYPIYAKLYNGVDPKTKQVVDPALNKAVTDFQTNMQSAGTVQTLTALAEQSIGAQLADFANPPKHVTYADGSDNMKDFLDKLLMQRLGTTPDKTTFNDLHYVAQMDVPKDPTTKKPITDTPLPDIDTKQAARLISVYIQPGHLQAKKPSPSPSPSTSSSASPTPTSTNQP